MAGVCHVVLTLLLITPDGKELTLKAPVETPKQIDAKEVTKQFNNDPTGLQLVVAPLKIKKFEANDVTPEDCKSLAERLNQ